MKEDSRDKRTIEQIRQHYEVEKELADKLRVASKKDRLHLYSDLYNELYRRVPLHPQLTRKQSPDKAIITVRRQLKLLNLFLNKDITYLEVGPGDCALALEVAKFVKLVYAVDVSDDITKASHLPANFKLILSDGCSVPVPPNSVDVAYSNQLMEHLHVDDALEQLQEIYNSLRPGGVYICITPNRMNGPHDVSKYFDVEAKGFHMKEYTNWELSTLFKNAGFSKVKLYVGGKGYYLGLPVWPVGLCEKLLDKIPPGLRKKLAHTFLIKQILVGLLGIRLVGVK